MNADKKVLYTDGHEVTVTDSFFKVKKSLYQLNGITSHGLYIIHPDRFVPTLVLLAGVLLLIAGASQIVPDRIFSWMAPSPVIVNGNSVAMALGMLLTIAGALILGLKRDKYAIRIETAEGKKNVIVSPKREYVNQIMDALNHAFLNLLAPTRMSKPVDPLLPRPFKG